MFGNSNYYFQGDFYLTNDQNNIIYVGNYYTNHSRYINIGQLFGNSANGKLYLPISSDRSDFRDTNNTILNYNIASGAITALTLQGDTNFTDSNNKTYSCKEFDGYFVATNGYGSSFTWDATNTNLYNYLNWENNNSKQVQLKEVSTSIYVPVKSQLDATADYVYQKTFYGKNGVEIGTLGNPDNTFTDVNAEVYAKIQQQYNNIQPRVLTNQDKTIDTSIKIIPCKSDGTPLLDTSIVTNMGSMFNSCLKLTLIPLLDTSNATYMDYMFNYCSSLITIPLLDTSNVTNMNNMFCNCKSLTTIPLLDTSSVTDMGAMFAYCSSLTTIPLLNTSNVTNMLSMFNSCSSLTTIPQLDTSSIASMYNMFNNCLSLTTIPLLDTSSVTNMSTMFNGCSSLTTIPLLNTSSVTNMLSMFRDCSSLTTIPQLDTSSVTSMNFMFNSCSSLTTIPSLNTGNVTTMVEIFRKCSNLTTVPVLNTSKVTYMDNAFGDCPNLSNTSLNNILQMCINATAYTGTKTLKFLGLTSTQATTCQTLSNWSAFVTAGWTTGY